MTMSVKCQWCGKWTTSPTFWEITHRNDMCDQCGKDHPEDVDVTALLADKLLEVEADLKSLLEKIERGD